MVLWQWNKDDDKKFHMLVTNKLNGSAKFVISGYLLRCGIEHCFKKLKDTFSFDQHQLRQIEKIKLACQFNCLKLYLLDKAERLS